MSKWVDENNIWWHTNDAGESKKLLLNPETKQPYKQGEIIHLNGRKFKEYRYDRVWASNMDYWPIKYMPAAKNLDTYDKSYKLPTPSLISFSGGRTSAYMLKKIIDAYNGKLPKDIIVCFANTGKELEETLEFVHECEKRWNVPIHWLELDIATTSPIWRSKEVSFETASRNGEPFEKLINKKGKLPSLHQRTCTIELKINTINRFMRSLGYKEWYSALGLRYDEPRRVSDSKKNSQKHINIAPLYEAKVTNEDILAYWKNSPFDLKLPSINGKTIAGNCDLCFLKGTQTTLNLLKERPQLANWWSDMETKHKAKFRTNRPDYIKLVDLSQKNFETELDDTHFSCFCHD